MFHWLIHVANLVYLASYSVKDIRKLRWLTVVGIVLLIPYYLSYGLWGAALWNIVFMAINLVSLRRKEKNDGKQVHSFQENAAGLSSLAAARAQRGGSPLGSARSLS